ncbi:reverse transcriptase domain-containing protein [Tanacetum coccineum]
MSNNIPFDIQMEIIKRVSDVKSLIRFTSVLKPWKSFIDSPEFIAFYRVRLSQPHRLLLRYENNVKPREFKHISSVDDVTFPQQQQDFDPNVSDLVKRFHDIITTQVAIDRFIFWVAFGYFDGNVVNGAQDFDRTLGSCPAYTNEVNDGRVYGVWMMGEEGGVMTSFTKLFTIKIPDSSSTMTLLGFRKSGQPIMETGKEDEEFAALEVYEPCSGHINNLGIYGKRNHYSFSV